MTTETTASSARAAMFSLRQAIATDQPSLDFLFSTEGMPLLPLSELLGGSVAVNSQGEVVGFIRVLRVDDAKNPAASGNYVYPVIVFASWRHHGVARALVQRELERRGALKLVACRPSRGFYQRCGFIPEDWEHIAAVIAQDCEKCPDRDSCDPQPYQRNQRKTSGSIAEPSTSS